MLTIRFRDDPALRRHIFAFIPTHSVIVLANTYMENVNQLDYPLI